jgi:anti-sigma B factor antagonist
LEFLISYIILSGWFGNKKEANMEIAVRTRGEFKVVDLVGKIDRLKDSINLKDFISALVLEGASKIALNLSQVTYLDSGALNVFIFSNNTLKKEKGELTLVEPNEYVMDVLEVVGLTRLISVFPTEKDFEKQISSNN